MSYCRACGKQLAEGTRFCSACGAETVPTAAPSVAAPAPVTAAPPVVAPPLPRRHRGRAFLVTLVVLLVLVAGAIAGGYFWWTSASVDPAAVEMIVVD